VNFALILRINNFFGNNMRKSIFVISLFFCSFNTLAKVDIHFSKVQFYLNGQARTDAFEVSNQGNELAHCSLGLSHFQVLEDGVMKRIEDGVDGAYNPANKLVRYSPRNVKVPPQSAQTVRISFRRLPKLQDGEYVSFLTVECDNGSIVRDGPRLKHNLPVIIRHGDINVNNEITSAKLMTKDGVNYVEIIHERLVDSTSSIIGNYIIIGKDSGDTYATLNNSKIYSPAKFKKITLQFKDNVTEPLQVKFTTEPKLGDEVVIVDVTD
jgi:hypothetical protein